MSRASWFFIFPLWVLASQAMGLEVPPGAVAETVTGAPVAPAAGPDYSARYSWLGVSYQLLPTTRTGVEEYAPEGQTAEDWIQMLCVQRLSLGAGGFEACLRRLRFQLEGTGGKEVRELGRGPGVAILSVRMPVPGTAVDYWCLLLVRTEAAQPGGAVVVQYYQHGGRMEQSSAELARLAWTRSFLAQAELGEGTP